MQRAVRVLGVLGLVAGAVTLLASPASAHVTITEEEVPADSYATLEVNLPHGCADEEDEEAPASPTKSITVHLPEEVSNVKPGVNPGWEIEIVEEELDEPLEGPYGEPITERITEVTWTAEDGQELPDEYRTSFQLGIRTTFAEPGDYLFFKTIQTCLEGETGWVEEYIEGVTEGEEPEEPSPVVLITEAEEGGEEAADAEEDDSDDGPSTGLAVAGLIAGLLGLAAGGTALYRTKGS